MSPFFPTVLDHPAVERRVIETPLGGERLPEPFGDLTLRRTNTALTPEAVAHLYLGETPTRMIPERFGNNNYHLGSFEAQLGVCVESIEDAEELVLNLALGGTAQEYNSGGSLKLPVLINYESMLIASRTRRGIADSVFMHPDNIALLGEWLTRGSREEIGCWIREGVLGSLTVYSNSHMTASRVVVALLGGGGPAQLVRRDNKTYIAFLAERPDAYSGPESFVGSIAIK